jgi:cardiolipin synthase
MAMAGASDAIRIITPYFVPGPRVVRSLLRASARGVKIQIMLPSVSDVPIVKLASRAYLTPLLKAGIEIYEREGTILHAKVMLIDDCWVTLGSANFDYRSFHRNHEVNVIADSQEFASQVERMFTDDLAKSRRVTFSEYEKRSWFERFLERLCDPIRRFL